MTALEALQQQSDTGSSGLNYLGRSGLHSVHGLNVAFIDGTYSSLEYREGVPGHGSAACRHFTQVSHCSSPTQLPCSPLRCAPPSTNTPGNTGSRLGPSVSLFRCTTASGM